MNQIDVRSAVSPRTARVIICLFFAAFLALGLLTAGDYGRPWDEADEMDILRMNLWEYSRQFGLDERAFVERANEEGLTINKLSPISESVESDHGISAFYPLAGVVMDATMSENTRMLLWHMYCWAIFTLGAFALYACCSELGLSRGAGLLGALFLLLSPRFFAQGHYNNKDIALFALTLCVLWQGLSLMRKPTFTRALAFALFGALAANTKVIGFALWGLCALLVLIRQIARRTFTHRTAWTGATALVGLLVFYALLTPALWGDPIGFCGYLIKNAISFQRWENYVLFRGTVFDLTKTRLPWYYLPFMILASTPLWALLLTFVGQMAVLRTLCGKRKGLPQSDHALSLLLVTLLWTVPLLFAMATHTVVYNGWRHFYFLYGPMLLLCVYGSSRLWHVLKRQKQLRAAYALLLVLSLVMTGCGIVSQHPTQYTYEQPIVQLRENGRFLELDYWNVSAVNALEKLAAQTEGELRIGAADLWAQAGLTHGVSVLPEELAKRFVIVSKDKAPRYILENPTYAVFSGFAPTLGMHDVVNITSYGQFIMRIYENTAATTEEAQP